MKRSFILTASAALALGAAPVFAGDKLRLPEATAAATPQITSAVDRGTVPITNVYLRRRAFYGGYAPYRAYRPYYGGYGYGYGGYYTRPYYGYSYYGPSWGYGWGPGIGVGVGGAWGPGFGMGYGPVAGFGGWY